MKILTREETVLWYQSIAASHLRGEKPTLDFSRAMVRREDLKYAADVFRKRFIEAFAKIPDEVISTLPADQPSESIKAALDKCFLDINNLMDATTESFKDWVSNAK